MKRIVALLILLLFATNVKANGGGPLLLIFNVIAFAVGSILIIAIEAAIYQKMAKLEIREAVKDAFWVNLWSTLIIGFGLPFAISIVSGIAGKIYAPIADYAFVIGTWVFDGIKHPKATIAFVYIWLIVAYFLTVPLESVLLLNRWRKRNYHSQITAKRLNWIGNSVTYFLLILSFTFGFGIEMWPKS